MNKQVNSILKQVAEIFTEEELTYATAYAKKGKNFVEMYLIIRGLDEGRALQINLRPVDDYKYFKSKALHFKTSKNARYYQTFTAELNNAIDTALADEDVDTIEFYCLEKDFINKADDKTSYVELTQDESFCLDDI